MNQINNTLLTIQATLFSLTIADVQSLAITGCSIGTFAIYAIINWDKIRSFFKV